MFFVYTIYKVVYVYFLYGLYVTDVLKHILSFQQIWFLNVYLILNTFFFVLLCELHCVSGYVLIISVSRYRQYNYNTQLRCSYIGTFKNKVKLIKAYSQAEITTNEVFF